MTKDQIREYMELSIQVMKDSMQEVREDAKPCPFVGAVLVRPNGTTETAYRGELRQGDHAEYTLLERKCRSEKLDGSVLFATLEPCAPGARHFPKLGCAERIVNARLKKVYIGIEDPDPTVDRKGIKFLQDNGVEVEMYPADLQREIESVNIAFLAAARERAYHAQEALNIQLSRTEDVVPEARLDDLSVELLADFVDRANLNCPVGSDECNRALSQLGILHLEDKTYRPTGLGMLLFGNNPQMSYPQAVVRATYKTAGRGEDIETFRDAIIRQPKLAYKWYSERLGKQTDRSMPERQTRYDYPIEVINELLKNAILHRDYDIEGAPIYFEINDEAIIIKSPGNPVSPLTMEQICNFSAPSLSRNPKIVYVFDILRMAEQRGLGFSTVKKLQSSNIPLPMVTYEAPYMVFTLPRYAKSAVLGERLSLLNEKELKGYEYIRTSPLPVSRQDYQDYLGLEKKMAERQLKRLQDLNLITKQGAGPSTAYIPVEESRQ